MPRVHFVKKARKGDSYAGIKKGDSYYWWKFRFGGKHKSKTPPKPSQLTRSEFWGTLLSLSERETPEFDELGSVRDDIVGELETLRDETQDKFDNMPDGLQQGDTGQLLEERVSALEDVISEVEGVDCDTDEDAIIEEVRENNEDAWGKLTEEQKTELIDEAKTEKAEEVWAEITGALEGVSCS